MPHAAREIRGTRGLRGSLWSDWFRNPFQRVVNTVKKLLPTLKRKGPNRLQKRKGRIPLRLKRFPIYKPRRFIGRKIAQCIARLYNAQVPQPNAIVAPKEFVLSWKTKVYQLKMEKTKSICVSGDSLVLCNNEGVLVTNKEGGVKKRFNIQEPTEALVNGDTLIVGTRKKGILFFNLNTGVYLNNFLHERVAPGGMAIDRTNKLIAVCDSGQNKVSVYYSLGFAGGKFVGSAAGQVDIYKPIGVKFMHDGKLVVTSEENITIYNEMLQVVQEYKGSYCEYPHSLVTVGETLLISFNSHIGLFKEGKEEEKIEESGCWAIAHSPEDNSLWCIKEETSLVKIKL